MASHDKPHTVLLAGMLWQTNSASPPDNCALRRCVVVSTFVRVIHGSINVVCGWIFVVRLHPTNGPPHHYCLRSASLRVERKTKRKNGTLPLKNAATTHTKKHVNTVWKSTIVRGTQYTNAEGRCCILCAKRRNTRILKKTLSLTHVLVLEECDSRVLRGIVCFSRHQGTMKCWVQSETNNTIK